MSVTDYKIGEWQLFTAQNSLQKGDEVKHLDHKSLQVLLYLIQHAGQAVSKDTLQQAVWSGKSTSADILSVAISNIRKALGDSAHQPQYIKTLPGKGYCLIAPVKPIRAGAYQGKVLYAAIASALLAVTLILYGYLSKPSQAINTDASLVAILPFADYSPDSNSHKLANGLADALIDNLYQSPRLRVMSRHSTFNQRVEGEDIAQTIDALSADFVLSGSVQRVDQQIRVVVALFDKNAKKIWSKTFDDTHASLFELQDKIAMAVKSELAADQPAPSPELLVTPEAYEAYVTGTYLYLQRTPEALRQGTKELKKAVELAPNFAKAHLALANSYAFQFGHAAADYQTMRQLSWHHVQRALELAPELSNAYASKGMLLTQDAAYAKGEQKAALVIKAENAFKRAFVLSEDQAQSYHWYGSLLLMMGEPQKAIEHYQKAIELNPLAPILHRVLAEAYANSGKPAKARESYTRASSLQPLSARKYYLQHFYQRLNHQHITDFFNQVDTPNCASSHDCQTKALMLYSLNEVSTARHWQLQAMGPRYLPQAEKLWLEIQYLAANDEQAKVTELLEKRVLLSNIPRYREQLVHAWLAQGVTNKARETLATLIPEMEQQAINQDNFDLMISLAHLLKLEQQTQLATPLLSRLLAYSSQVSYLDNNQTLVTQAEIHALSGDHQTALRLLKQAIEQGWISDKFHQWWSLSDNPRLQSLQQTPELRQLQSLYNRQSAAFTKSLTL